LGSSKKTAWFKNQTVKLRLPDDNCITFSILGQSLFYPTMTEHFYRNCFILFIIGGFALYLFLAKIQDQRFKVNLFIFTGVYFINILRLTFSYKSALKSFSLITV
jgi:hypothetical protein